MTPEEAYFKTITTFNSDDLPEIEDTCCPDPYYCYLLLNEVPEINVKKMFRCLIQLNKKLNNDFASKILKDKPEFIDILKEEEDLNNKINEIIVENILQ